MTEPFREDPGSGPRPDRAVTARPGRGAERLRPYSAPEPGPLQVCPHCWHVNLRAERLCGRCGADMTMALQESGGARRAAAVQSPVPVTGSRLSRAQRLVVLGFLALLALGQLVVAFAPRTGVRAPPLSAPSAH